MTGESRATIENSPHMEAFRAKGYEVLLLTDPVDEVWVERVGAVRRQAAAVDRQGRRSTWTPTRRRSRPSRARAAAARTSPPLLTWLGEQLDRQVKEVRLSSRLTTSPACLVGDAHDITPTLEKMYRAMGQEVPHDQADPGAQPGPPAGRPGCARPTSSGRDDGGPGRDRRAAVRHGAAGRGRRADRPGPLRPAARRPAGAHAVGPGSQWSTAGDDLSGRSPPLFPGTAGKLHIWGLA